VKLNIRIQSVIYLEEKRTGFTEILRNLEKKTRRFIDTTRLTFAYRD